MDLVSPNFLPGDPRLIDQIVYELKSQGIFDQFRKECIADVDTKPAYQNLSQRVEGSVLNFLKQQKFAQDINKNQLRDQLRKNISDSGFLDSGVERIVDQVVNPKINTVFLPKVEDVVYRFLGIERPNAGNPPQEVKKSVDDLLPNDLEAVSPESAHDHSANSSLEKKEEIVEEANDNNSLNSSNAKTEDESPPFEPLEDNTKFLVHEENSVDSHLSGISGLASHDSTHSNDVQKIPNQMDISQDVTQNSVNSEGNLSIVTSEEDTKMEVCEDIATSHNLGDKCETVTNKSPDEFTKESSPKADVDKIEHDDMKEERCEIKISISNNLNETNLELDITAKRRDEKKELIKDDSKRTHDKHRSSRSDKDKKEDKDKKVRSKSESKSRDYKDISSSKRSSSKDKEKEKKEYTNGKEEQIKYRIPKKEDKERDKSSSKIIKDNKDKCEKIRERSEKSRDKSDKDKEKSNKDKERSTNRDKERGKFDKDKERSEADKYRDKYKSNIKDKSDKNKPEKEKYDRDKSTSAKHNKEKSISSKKDGKEKDKHEDKPSRDKSSSSKEKTSSGSKHKESSSKDKDSSKKDKDRAKLASTTSKEKERDKENKDKKEESKSKSSDKHKRSDKDKSSSHHDKSSTSSRRDKEKKITDDHYSLKDKKSDRRSTDRDSNDGSSKMSRNNSFNETYSSSCKASSKESSEVFSSGGGDSSNSDKIEEKPLDGIEAPVRVESSNAEAIAPFKYIKPKFASNIHEAMKLMKIRKQLAKLERENQLALTHVPMASVNNVELKEVQHTAMETPEEHCSLVKSSAISQQTSTATETLNSPPANNVKKMAELQIRLKRFTTPNTCIAENIPILKSHDLSMESFEALEARLAQEMSNVNDHMYGDEDDSYEYSSIIISPLKKPMTSEQSKVIKKNSEDDKLASDTVDLPCVNEPMQSSVVMEAKREESKVTKTNNGENDKLAPGTVDLPCENEPLQSSVVMEAKREESKVTKTNNGEDDKLAPDTVDLPCENEPLQSSVVMEAKREESKVTKTNNGEDDKLAPDTVDLPYENEPLQSSVVMEAKREESKVTKTNNGEDDKLAPDTVDLPCENEPLQSSVVMEAKREESKVTKTNNGEDDKLAPDTVDLPYENEPLQSSVVMEAKREESKVTKTNGEDDKVAADIVGLPSENDPLQSNVVMEAKHEDANLTLNRAQKIDFDDDVKNNEAPAVEEQLSMASKDENAVDDKTEQDEQMIIEEPFVIASNSDIRESDEPAIKEDANAFQQTIADVIEEDAGRLSEIEVGPLHNEFEESSSEFRGFTIEARNDSSLSNIEQLFDKLSRDVDMIAGRSRLACELPKENVNSLQGPSSSKYVKHNMAPVQNLLLKNGKKLVIKIVKLYSELTPKVLVTLQDTGLKDVVRNKISDVSDVFDKEGAFNGAKGTNTILVCSNEVEIRQNGQVTRSHSLDNKSVVASPSQCTVAREGFVKYEDENSPCRYFNKTDSVCETKLTMLHDIIAKLEKSIEEQSLRIQNNIPKPMKRGRKRKIHSTENNNSIGCEYRPERKRKLLSDANSQNGGNLCNTDVSSQQSFSLPLSPAESDKSEEHKKEPITVKTKRTGRGSTTQRYSCEDLYKPRPIILSCSSSRRRGGRLNESRTSI